MLLLEEVCGVATVTNTVLKLAGYVGITPTEIGEPEVTRVELALIGFVGNPTVGSEDTLRLPLDVGSPLTDDRKPEEGREVMVELNDNVGNPEEASEVLRFSGSDENPELGRVVKLAFAEGNGTPELGAVIVGRRVVALDEIVGVRLGTEKLVKLEKVGAIVGWVPDEAKVFERDSEVLELGKGGDALELREPTMLEPVPMADVTAGPVVKGGMGTTGIVDDLVVGADGKPCRVRSEVVVPVVTYT